MRRIAGSLGVLLLLLVAGCTNGVEPNGCQSDLHIAVDGGATVRFHWDSGCQGDALSQPYRDR